MVQISLLFVILWGGGETGKQSFFRRLSGTLHDCGCKAERSEQIVQDRKKTFCIAERVGLTGTPNPITLYTIYNQERENAFLF